MASESGFPLVDDWPDEPAWHTCRFNSSYLSEVTGALMDYAYAPLWDGTESEQQGMLARINVLIEQISTPYECEVSSMSDVFQVAYVLPANTQGSGYSGSTWTQVPYNTVDIDTASACELVSGGTVILPTGTYLLEISHMPRNTNGAYLKARVVDGTSTLYTSAVETPNTCALHAKFIISSDGETPITICFYSNDYAYLFGWTYVYDFIRRYGTATFTKLA